MIHTLKFQFILIFELLFVGFSDVEPPRLPRCHLSVVFTASPYHSPDQSPFLPHKVLEDNQTEMEENELSSQLTSPHYLSTEGININFEQVNIDITDC